MFPLALLNSSLPPTNPNILLLCGFESDFTDGSSFNRNFTTEIGDPSIVDSSLFLNDDILTTADVSGFDLLSSDFTMEFYIKVSSHTATLRGLFGISDATFTKGFRVYFNSTDQLIFQCRISGVGGFSSITVPTAFAIGTRTKVAVVKSGSTVRILVNDVVAVTQTFGSTLVSYASETSFKIGVLVGLIPNQYAKNIYLDNLKIIKEVLY